MSRALDKSVKEALKNGDHGEVYSKLVAVLTQRFDSLLDIELLGPSHPIPGGAIFLQDENAIAVPKLRLIQAFIAARKKLNQERSSDDGPSTQVVLESTAVILLTDAEHLTAANARKRVLENEISRDHQTASGLLQKEKYFIDSLLTSRLHRHTKSPNLWSHRRWVMGCLKTLSLPIDVAGDLRSVIFISGERHPRNYYAWCHARYMMDVVGGDLSTAVEDTKKWCFTHHDDISGWMFLLFLLDRDGVRANDIFTETMKLAESFHWRNESVWYFLRNMALSRHVGGEVPQEFYDVLARLGGGGDEEDRRILDEAASWARRYDGVAAR